MSKIDKMNSNSDLSCVSNKQLFTELTPEEGAVVAGGAVLVISHIQAVKAGADTFGDDDTYITVNGNQIWGPKGFSTGQTRGVNYANLEFEGSATIRLFDSDSFLNGDDDPMGGFTVFSSQRTNGIQKMTVRGGGSTYDVYYGVAGSIFG